MKKAPKPQKSGRKFTIKKLRVEQRFTKIIVVIFLTNIALCATAQTATRVPVVTIEAASKKSFSSVGGTSWHRNETEAASNHTGERVIFPKTLSSIIRPDFYTINFGFFCKQELQFEKTMKIPLRFRLGSLQECNRLENK